jgi:predicted nucleic acid-binding protein
VSVFVDTSALYALLDGDDAGHDRALRGSGRILGEELVTHSYVVVETVSLVRRRLGAEAAARLIDDILPAIKIVDVDEVLRGRAVAAFRAGVSSAVSLVDRTSFECMRTFGISRAYALDADFEAEGFELVS